MTESPYSAPRAPKAFKPFKRNPYGFRSKWNGVRVLNLAVSGGLALSALNEPDQLTQGLKLVLWGIHGKYYIDNLYNIEDMERTLVHWGFRWKSLEIPHIKKNQNIKVKFRLKNKDHQKYCPVDEIHVLKNMTIVQNTDNNYTVLVNGNPKKYDDESREELELRNKKFLDGLHENRYFKSIQYTVTDPKKECRRSLEESAQDGEPNKARDLHMQDLIQYVDDDKRQMSVTKYQYMLDLGFCADIEEAVLRYKSIVPGFENLMKYAASGFYIIKDPLEIWKIFEEMYDNKEAY